DRHTDGNDDTGNTRKGQGSTNPGHDCQDYCQVKYQRKIGNHTKHTEEYHHPDCNQNETDLGRQHTLVDALLTQTWTNYTFFYKVHWRSQRTCTQHQGKFSSFLWRVQAGNTELRT